jgi:hypothetical protein
MAELVDALLSGSSAARRGGSSPLQGTKILFEKIRDNPKIKQKQKFNATLGKPFVRLCPR